MISPDSRSKEEDISGARGVNIVTNYSQKGLSCFYSYTRVLYNKTRIITCFNPFKHALFKTLTFALFTGFEL